MNKIIVLGIGNRLMMDDGIGTYIVEDLRNKNISDNIKFVIGETDLDYCLDAVQDSNFIIIIDAIKMGKSPGEIYQISLKDIEYLVDDSQHNMSIINSIKLYYKELNGIIIGIEPFEVRYRLGISEPLEEKIQGIINKIESIILNKILET